MKIKLLLALLFIIGLGAVVWWKQSNKILSPNSSTGIETSPQQGDIETIRAFMNNPNLEVSSIGTDLPAPYFRVGKVTKVGNGENMEAVDDWVRKVNMYDEKIPLNDGCYVYEYQLDARNHKLTSVSLKGLHPSEILDLKSKGITCVENPKSPRITKSDAESVAMSYLQRAVPNFDQIKDQFVYSTQNKGESHEWLWQDKSYKLSQELSSRPYPGPMIRISVYGNSEIQYWNTTSLFKS